MNVQRRVQTLEKASQGTAQTVTVTYKPGSGKAAKQCSLETAFELARRGELEAISFPLTYEEQQVKRRDGFHALDAAFEQLDGINRDTSPAHDVLVLCSKPVIYARQAPPHEWNGRMFGGYYITTDGEEFHQSDCRALLNRRNAGTIIVEAYDETKEPFYQLLHKGE